MAVLLLLLRDTSSRKRRSAAVRLWMPCALILSSTRSTSAARIRVGPPARPHGRWRRRAARAPAAPDWTMTSARRRAGGGCGAPARERPGAGRRDSRSSAPPRCARWATPSSGQSGENDDVDADQQEDQGPGLDRHREREDQQLGVGPEQREGDADAEHRARGADERRAPGRTPRAAAQAPPRRRRNTGNRAGKPGRPSGCSTGGPKTNSISMLPQQMQQAAVDEHVGDEGPRPAERLAGRELQSADEAPGR